MRIKIPVSIQQYSDLNQKDYYFISRLVSSRNLIKRSESRNKKPKDDIHKYCSISSKRLRALFGEKYKDHIERLEGHGIIAVNNHYKPQGFKSNFGFTKSYKILPFDSDRMIEFTIQDKVTLNSIKRYVEWNDSYIDQVVQVQNNNLQLLENTEGLNLNTTVDSAYKLHNDLVDSKQGKLRRKKITYKGERFTQLDIKNTYPSLLYYLIPAWLKEENDVKFYLQMVESARLIPCFKEMLTKSFPKITDEKIKKGLNYFLNHSRNERIFDPVIIEINRLFKVYLPNVYKTMNQYRGNRSYLSWTTLAKIESTLMNKYLLHWNERIHDPLIRIHDCIMVRKSLKDFCIREFNNFCKQELGFNLVLREKND